MGILGDAYDAVAGAADHAAGSVDESIGRQFDDSPGGGFADVAPEGSGGAEVDTDGDGQPDEYNNRFLVGPVRTAWDATFSYDGTLNGSGDSVDLFGPTSGAVADALVHVEGEDVGAEERKARWFLIGGVALVVLYLVRPLLTVLAEVVGGE